MSKKVVNLFERMINWLKEHNWQFIAWSAVFLTLFEAEEIFRKGESLTDPYHWFELVIYLVILIFVGMLVDGLVKSNKTLNEVTGILNYKHNISREFAKIDDWETLKTELIMLPGRIADVYAVRLQIHNPVSSKLEEVATWQAEASTQVEWYDDYIQSVHRELANKEDANVFVVRSDAVKEQSHCQEYCIPIRYGISLLALIQIKSKPDRELSTEQIELFQNISPEIAFALKASQERKELSDMKLAKAAMAERRSISTFIHDQLGQNLGYLHLKLDQLIENGTMKEDETIQSELYRMRDVANESYEIVRDILKKIQTETVPHFTNLLQEHARTVAARARFELNFEAVGKPMPLLPVVQQSVFFTFCEIIGNVEKHANASKVDVLVIWNNGILDISVSDNGNGFEPDLTRGDDHFGLQIMRERIAGLQGKFMINSSSGSGTVVSISVPFKTIKAVAV